MLGKKSFFGIEIIHRKPQTLKLQYVLGAGLVKQEPSFSVIEFDRKQFFINGKEPLRLFDELAERCIKSIYPIHIKVSKENKMISVPNIKKMQSKWKKELKLLKKEFKGDTVDTYFEQISQNLSTEKKFLKSLDCDIGYSLLLSIHTIESTGPEKQNGIRFPFPITPYNPKNVFYGSFSSKLEHNGKRMKSFKGIDETNGNLEINYLFGENLFFVNKIEGNFSSKTLGKEIGYRVTYLKNRQN
ncbi:hypothetical protein [Zobellia uliginosa]|uniref:hypothetical protein n=1 Tax=Zobellia uliginosa TaxID=143224 RepID=UPI0026E40852|nr:hypothetical protein [Zobellia uliginosa]MDO6519049.1 hypothetical protein [Zobellia uliginosa]